MILILIGFISFLYLISLFLPKDPPANEHSAGTRAAAGPASLQARASEPVISPNRSSSDGSSGKVPLSASGKPLSTQALKLMRQLDLVDGPKKIVISCNMKLLEIHLESEEKQKQFDQLLRSLLEFSQFYFLFQINVSVSNSTTSATSVGATAGSSSDAGKEDEASSKAMAYHENKIRNFVLHNLPVFSENSAVLVPHILFYQTSIGKTAIIRQLSPTVLIEYEDDIVCGLRPHLKYILYHSVSDQYSHGQSHDKLLRANASGKGSSSTAVDAAKQCNARLSNLLELESVTLKSV